jgi:hypothetical protein
MTSICYYALVFMKAKRMEYIPSGEINFQYYWGYKGGGVSY